MNMHKKNVSRVRIDFPAIIMNIDTTDLCAINRWAMQLERELHSGIDVNVHRETSLACQ